MASQSKGELWRNPKAGSTDYVRVQTIIRQNETEERVKLLNDRYKAFSGRTIEVSTKKGVVECLIRIIPCMNDGKCRNFINGQRCSASCGHCFVLPSQMNGSTYQQMLIRPVEPSHLATGCSIEHLRPKILEMNRNIAARLRLPKKFQKSRSPDAERTEASKQVIKNSYEEMDPLCKMDRVQSGGVGTPGNSARAAFHKRNHKKFSEINGVPLWYTEGQAALLILGG